MVRKKAVVACVLVLWGCTGWITQGTPGAEDWFAESGRRETATPYEAAVLAFQQSPIVKEKSCLSCHTIGDRGGTVGPILDQVANRRSEDWLRKWLKDPNQIKANTKMPNLELTDAEIDELLGYALKLKKEIPTQAILASGDSPAVKGKRLLEAYGCKACHRIGDEGRFIGVDLTWVGHRKTELWERQWLKDPPAWKPEAFMPNCQLTDQEVEALAAYLHTLQGQTNEASRRWETQSLFFMGGSAETAGKMIYDRFGCWSCHGQGGGNADKNPNAAPNGQVPELWGVKNRRSEQEIRGTIRNGSVPKKLNPEGPPPPFVCPAWGESISDRELDILIAYVNTLAPKERKWKFR